MAYSGCNSCCCGAGNDEDGTMTWQPIDEARFIRLGTIAILKMRSGRKVRARWTEFGRCTAWWPDPGQQHKKPIGLYDPAEFQIIAHGHSFDDGTHEGMSKERSRRA